MLTTVNICRDAIDTAEYMCSIIQFAFQIQAWWRHDSNPLDYILSFVLSAADWVLGSALLTAAWYFFSNSRWWKHNSWKTISASAFMSNVFTKKQGASSKECVRAAWSLLVYKEAVLILGSAIRACNYGWMGKNIASDSFWCVGWSTRFQLISERAPHEISIR